MKEQKLIVGPKPTVMYMMIHYQRLYDRLMLNMETAFQTQIDKND